jgi:hypothetical protein
MIASIPAMVCSCRRTKPSEMIILTVPILVRMRKLATVERFFDPILDRALGNAHLLRDGVHRPAAVTQHKHLLSLLPTSCLTPAAVPLLRSELLAEAIRLTRMVPASLPEDPEVAGLLALTTPARRRDPARPCTQDGGGAPYSNIRDHRCRKHIRLGAEVG